MEGLSVIAVKGSFRDDTDFVIQFP
jgi:hypothetical protein